MKKHLCILLAVCLLGLGGCGGGGTVDVTAKGVVANDPSAAAQNRKTLQTLLEKADGGALYFPAGDYYIDSGLILYKRHDVTLRGEGATLVNTGYDPTAKQAPERYMDSRLLTVEKSRNITLDGLALDYARYTQACGVVEKTDALTTTVSLDEAFLDGSYKTALTGGEYIMAVNVLDQNGVTKSDHYAPDEGFAARLENGKLILAGNFGKPGDRVMARFTLGTYASPAVVVMESEHLTVQNMSVYSCPSAVFYCPSGNDTFVFDNLAVKTPDGSPQWWGTNVDSLHIKGLRGNLTVKNSTFDGLGDDALNVHSPALTVDTVDGNTLTFIDRYDGRNESLRAEAGDTFAFYGADYTKKGLATVVSAKGKTVTLDTLPDGVKAGDIVQNCALSPVVRVENCTVQNGRARGFLFQARDVTVTNCAFTNLGLAGILAAPDFTQWYEAGPVENLLLQNCSFDRVCTMAWENAYGAVTVRLGHNTPGSAQNVHGTVTVQDCSFANVKTPVYTAGVTTVEQ